jgi:hypothetical protein
MRGDKVLASCMNIVRLERLDVPSLGPNESSSLRKVEWFAVPR